tara:strand:- start:875 stop:1150 length:276 start_codon:yes stop_codon:yes gene_type:complete
MVKTKEEKRLHKVIDCLLEENRKLLDFKVEIKQSIENHVASNLNDKGVLMIVQKMAIQRMLEDNEQVEHGHMSLEEWREKHNKLFGKYKNK